MKVFYSQIGFNPDPDNPDADCYYLSSLENGYVSIVNQHDAVPEELPATVLAAMARHLSDLDVEVLPVAEEEAPF